MLRDVAGVGLDVEQDEELRPELERMICTPPERAWLDSQPSARRGQLGKLFFSAKEAFYKAQYPLTRAYLDFRDVDLHLDLPGGTFAVARIGRAQRARDQNVVAIETAQEAGDGGAGEVWRGPRADRLDGRFARRDGRRRAITKAGSTHRFCAFQNLIRIVIAIPIK